MESQPPYIFGSLTPLKKHEGKSVELAISTGWNKSVKTDKTTIWEFPLIGNRLFNFQTKYYASIKRNTEVKRFLSFYTVTIYICMYVSAIATAYTVWDSKMKFELECLKMILSKCIFLFSEIFIFYGVLCLFSLFTISYEQRLWNG